MNNPPNAPTSKPYRVKEQCIILGRLVTSGALVSLTDAQAREVLAKNQPATTPVIVPHTTTPAQAD